MSNPRVKVKDGRPVIVTYKPSIPGPTLPDQKSTVASAFNYLTSPVRLLSNNVSSLFYGRKSNRSNKYKDEKVLTFKPCRQPKFAQRYSPNYNEEPTAEQVEFPVSVKPRPIVVTSKQPEPPKTDPIPVRADIKKGKEFELRRRHGNQEDPDTEAWRRVNTRKPSKIRVKGSKRKFRSRSPQSVVATRSITRETERPHSWTENVVVQTTPAAQAVCHSGQQKAMGFKAREANGFEEKEKRLQAREANGFEAEQEKRFQAREVNDFQAGSLTQSALDYLENQNSIIEESEKIERFVPALARARNIKREISQSPNRGVANRGAGGRESRRGRSTTPTKMVLQPKRVAMTPRVAETIELNCHDEPEDKWGFDTRPKLISDFKDNENFLERWSNNEPETEPIVRFGNFGEHI